MLFRSGMRAWWRTRGHGEHGRDVPDHPLHRTCALYTSRGLLLIVPPLLVLRLRAQLRPYVHRAVVILVPPTLRPPRPPHLRRLGQPDVVRPPRSLGRQGRIHREHRSGAHEPHRDRGQHRPVPARRRAARPDRPRARVLRALVPAHRSLLFDSWVSVQWTRPGRTCVFTSYTSLDSTALLTRSLWLACTGADGTLSFSEIQNILSTNSGATPVYDQTAQVKYLVYDTVSWRSIIDRSTTYSPRSSCWRTIG